MAIYTVKEFAKACGVTPSYLAVYVKRDQVILTPDGNVDGNHEVNRLFFEKRRKDDPAPVMNGPESIKSSPASPPPVFTNPSSSGEFMTFDSIAKQKEKLAMEKLSTEVRLNRLKEEKMLGELIPTDLVKPLVAQYAKSMITAFKNATENLIKEISKKHNISTADTADIRHRLVPIINQASTEAVEHTMKEIRNIQNEIAEKRGRGERK